MVDWFDPRSPYPSILVDSTSVRESKRFRLAQFRPNVTADFVLDSERGAVFFVLENAGSITAKDVHIAIEPPLINPKKPTLSLTPDLHPWLEQGVAVMVPGKAIRTLVAIYGDFPVEDDVSFRVEVDYAAEGRRRRLDDTFILDLSALRHVKQSDARGLHSVANELGELNGILSKVEISVREISTHMLGLDEGLDL